MMDTDEPDLRELQQELISVETSPWQPSVIAKAFQSDAPELPFVFTMQTWVDLSAARSPFLLGRLPEGDENLFGHFHRAFAAFGYKETTPEECDWEEWILLGQKMIRAITDGFSTQVKVSPRGKVGCEPYHDDNGMGDWLPILACLVGQMGFRREDALITPVAQAFALIASHRCNTGWYVVGETYATREVDTGKEDDNG